MIKDSLHFKFDDRSSFEFCVINSSMSDGLYKESIIGNKSVYDSYHNGKNYFYRVEKDPINFDLFLYLDPTLSKKEFETKLEEIAVWLDVDTYKPLIFESNTSRIYYAMPYGEVELIHNGNGQGYIWVPMRCDSSYCYSPYYGTGFIRIDGEKIYEINNLGHVDISPEMHIKKIGDGDLKITNLSNAKNSLSLRNLVDKEKVKIHKSGSLEAEDYMKFYDDGYMNRNIKLPYGKNRILIQGDCYISFLYRYMFYHNG